MSEVNGKALLSETTVAIRALLTKGDLIEKVAGVTEVSQKEAPLLWNGYSTASWVRCAETTRWRSAALESSARERASRLGRNPKTGARVEVPAKRVPFFKPSKELRKLIEKP